MRLATLAPALGPAAMLALAGCHHEARLSADEAWVRLSAVAGHPAAAYLVIHGGAQPVRLVAVESGAAGSSELHRSMKMGAGGMTGMTGMQRLDGLVVPARQDIAFAPGGYHVMLFGVSPQVKPGGRLTLSVRFERERPLTIDARVVGAGDPAPYGS